MRAKLLIGMLILGLGWSQPAASGSVLLYDGFEGYPTGYELNEPPWHRYRYDGDAHATVVEAPYTGDKSVHFDDPGPRPHEIVLGRSFPANSEPTTIEYYMKTASSSDEGARIGIQGDAGHDSCATFSNGAFGGAAGYIGVWGPLSGWREPRLLSYLVDQWYYFRRTLDYAANTETFYVEELVNEPGHPGNRSASYKWVGLDYRGTYVDEVLMSTSGSQGADCYVDGLRITPEPAALTLLALGAAAAILRRRS